MAMTTMVRRCPADAASLAIELDELFELERAAVLALGRAWLRGLPGTAAAEELRAVRTAIEAAAAAQRLLDAGRV